MADPKIRYDIEANATGEADVRRLATQLEKLDDAIDPQAAARAKELAAKLRELGQQQAAIDTFTQLKEKTGLASRALDEAQAAAQAAGAALRNSGPPTKAQIGELEKLRDAVKSAKAELQGQTAALDNARGGLTKLGLASDNLAAGQRQVRAALQATRTDAEAVAKGYQATAAAAEQSATRQQASHRSIKEGITSISTQLQQLQTLASVAVGGGVLGGLAKDAADTADQYSNLAARIRLVTGEGAAFDTAFEGVFDVATRTNSSLEETGNLFTRLAEAGKAIGLSQKDALALTETINQAIQLSGGSAESAKAAIIQLVQGLQSGVVRGEEFNSIMEQSPRLAKALAEGLGVTTGELRKLSEQGALTTSTVINALQGQSAALQREFSQLPPTVGRALQNLSTEWTRYIGEADKANGVSAAAAKALTLLAGNLDTVGVALKTAGQAYAAYKAFDLAAVYLRQAAATRELIAQQAVAAAAEARETVLRNASTAATVANTAATGANTAAKAANAVAGNVAAAADAAAAAAAAASTATLQQRVGLLGRFGGAIGLAATATALFGDLVFDTFRTAGTWIGETAAKLAGYTDRTKELEALQKLEAQTARESAQAKAEWAAQAKVAADAALGLTVEAQKIVGQFDEMRRKGETAGEALEKLGKGLNLGDTAGIQAAGAALDALAVRGQIAADQVQAALAKALSGRDLGVFEASARAAFDSSEQGARRLKAALDAVADESLRRAGTSAQELSTGFSAASLSAINDVDALAKTLDSLGVKGDDAGQLLAKALNKALEASTTDKAVQAVTERLQVMGKEGKLNGELLATGLEAARKKADDLRSGVNSVAEAYAVFGIKTKAELQAVADKNRQAWQLIKNDATSSLAVKQQAFSAYAESAVAANGGVVDSSLKNEAQALKVAIQFDATGKAIVKAMEAGGASVAKTTKLVNALGEEVNAAGERINQLASGFNGSLGGTGSNRMAADGGANLSTLGPSGQTTYSVGGSQLRPPDDSGDWEFVPDSTWGSGLPQWEVLQAAQQGKPVPRGDVAGIGYWRRRGGTGSASPGSTGSSASSGGGSSIGSVTSRIPSPTPAPAPSGAGPSSAAGKTVVIKLDLGPGNVATVPTTEDGASQLEAALREALKRRGG